MIPPTRFKTQLWLSNSGNFIQYCEEKHTLPRCGLVKIWIAQHILCFISFGVVLFAKVCFFLPMQFCKAVDFTLALLSTNFNLQYLMNYSSDFTNFYRLWKIEVYNTPAVLRRPEIWGPNFYSPFFKIQAVLLWSISNNDTNHKN